MAVGRFVCGDSLLLSKTPNPRHPELDLGSKYGGTALAVLFSFKTSPCTDRAVVPM